MAIDFQHVFFTYNPKTPLAANALRDVNFTIEKGSFTALVGRTGSGKSTIAQLINSLLHPSDGLVKVDDFINSSDKKENKKFKKKIPELRRHVGLVFQFPEYQLFDQTVEKDVSFAPKNFGMNEEEALEAAHEALKQVGLDESFYERSPFELSGGEKRRVAIAGILAFKPETLIIDEPTAGLDPAGAKMMMDLFEKVHEQGTTIILVTHDMNLVLSYCDKVIVMEDGSVAKIAKPSDLFQEDIEQYALETPDLYRMVKKLKERGMPLDFSKIHDLDSLLDEIISCRKERK